MYLDIYKNGNKHYIRISETKRIFSTEKNKMIVKKTTIKNIGPVDKFDDGQSNFIQRLRDSFDAGLPIIKELEPYVNKKQPKEVYNFRILAGTNECVGEPKLFACSLFDYILEEIGLRSYIGSYKQYDGISYDVLGFIKLLLYGRILNPQSKIATVRQNDNYYTNLLDEGAYEYNVFDTLDFVYKHRKAFFNRIDTHMRKKFGRTTNKIYYDVTNFFFEIDNPDVEIDEDGNETETGIRFCGVSKEHSPNPIVQMGLLMDEQGFPISIECFKGNTLDHLTMQKSFNNSIDSINNSRYIFVSDKGIGKGDNPKYAVANGNGYIVSKSIRGTTKKEKKWILSDDDWKLTTETFKIKSKIYEKVFKFEDGTEIKTSEKIVTYWSKKYYERDYIAQKSYYDFLNRLINEPNSFRITKIQSGKLNKYFKKELTNKNTGEIINSNDLKAMLDMDKLKEDFDLLGYYSIVTSETEMDDEEIISTYRNLSKIEDEFRVMKTALETKPLYVRTEEHIIAHLTLCTISLLILRIIQNQIKLKHPELKKDDTKYTFGLSTDRIKTALLKWQVEKLADEYYRFNNINDKDLSMILDSFDLKIQKKLYSKLELRQMKSNMKISM